jgi:hydrogenase 3 maturation protease
MTKGVILTVGNDLMGDDAAGPLLAEMLSQMPAGEWDIIDGGSAPENEVHNVRALQPDRVLIVDATEMHLPPGEIRIVDESIIGEQVFTSTHILPLTFLIQLLRDFVPDVQLLGIQPSSIAFASPLSDEVRQAVQTIHENLRLGASLDLYVRL